METSIFYANLDIRDQMILLIRSIFSELRLDIQQYCLANDVFPKIAIDFMNKNIFVNIPHHTGFKITMNGRVADINKGFEIVPTLNKLGYPAVTVRRDGIARSMTCHIHRLLAITFLKLPAGLVLADLQVNHIDGIKTNNDLDNLEWCSSSYNLTHAYRIGLRPTVHVTATNVLTGENLQFQSMKDVGDFFNVSTAAIHWQLNCRKSKDHYKGYCLNFA